MVNGNFMIVVQFLILEVGPAIVYSIGEKAHFVTTCWYWHPTVNKRKTKL